MSSSKSKSETEKAWERQLKSWGFKNEKEYQKYQDKEKAKLLNKNKQGKTIRILGVIVICLVGLYFCKISC